MKLHEEFDQQSRELTVALCVASLKLGISDGQFSVLDLSMPDGLPIQHIMPESTADGTILAGSIQFYGRPYGQIAMGTLVSQYSEQGPSGSQENDAAVQPPEAPILRVMRRGAQGDMLFETHMAQEPPVQEPYIANVGNGQYPFLLRSGLRYENGVHGVVYSGAIHAPRMVAGAETTNERLQTSSIHTLDRLIVLPRIATSIQMMRVASYTLRQAIGGSQSVKVDIT